MATNVAGTTAREPNHALVCWEGVAIDFSTFVAGFQVQIGTLPKGSRLLRVTAIVSVIFNAGTNNGISLGSAAGGAQFIAAETTSLTVLGIRPALGGYTLVASAAEFMTVDTPLWLNANISGAAATTGHADIIAEYVVTHGTADNF